MAALGAQNPAAALVGTWVIFCLSQPGGWVGVIWCWVLEGSLRAVSGCWPCVSVWCLSCLRVSSRVSSIPYALVTSPLLGTILSQLWLSCFPGLLKGGFFRALTHWGPPAALLGPSSQPSLCLSLGGVTAVLVHPCRWLLTHGLSFSVVTARAAGPPAGCLALYRVCMGAGRSQSLCHPGGSVASVASETTGWAGQIPHPHCPPPDPGAAVPVEGLGAFSVLGSGSPLP